MDRAGRYIVAALLIYVVIRVAPTVETMSALFVGSLYVLGAMFALVFAAFMAEYVTIEAGKKWDARVFDACGILHADGRPCLLPQGHRDTEHATAWTVCDNDHSIEHRHRFDDTGDRLERRAARGQLPKVNRVGEVPAAVSTK